MEDSRVALRLPELVQAASDELKWLIDTDISAWTMLAGLIGSTGEQLMDECIRGAHVSYHFLWRRIFQVASDLPWSLVRGDIEANVRRLGALEVCPEEQMSGQLWQLLKIGHPLAQLVGAVRVLGEAGWTSVPAEQQHGTLAAFRRWHPEYGTDTLLSRAMMLQLSRVLPSQSADAKRVSAIVKKIKKLNEKNPAKIGGRHMFLQGLVRIAHLRKREGRGEAAGLPGQEITKRWFGRHAVVWAARSLREQQAWADMARRTVGEKRAALTTELSQLSSELDTLLDRMGGADSEGRPLCMSVACLSQEDLMLFDYLTKQAEFRKASRIAALRTTAMSSAEPLSEPKYRALELIAVWKATEPEMPEWANKMCRNREYFENGAVIMTSPDGSERAYLIVYIVKMPFLVAVAPLRPDPEYEPSELDESADVRDLMKQHCGSYWKCNFGELMTAADVPMANEARMRWLPRLWYIGGTSLYSRCTQWPFLKFFDQIPAAVAQTKEDDSAKKKDDDYDALILEFPWLQYLDEKAGPAATFADGFAMGLVHKC